MCIFVWFWQLHFVCFCCLYVSVVCSIFEFLFVVGVLFRLFSWFSCFAALLCLLLVFCVRVFCCCVCVISRLFIVMYVVDFMCFCYFCVLQFSYFFVCDFVYVLFCKTYVALDLYVVVFVWFVCFWQLFLFSLYIYCFYILLVVVVVVLLGVGMGVGQCRFFCVLCWFVGVFVSFVICVCVILLVVLVFVICYCVRVCVLSSRFLWLHCVWCCVCSFGYLVVALCQFGSFFVVLFVLFMFLFV